MNGEVCRRLKNMGKGNKATLIFVSTIIIIYVILAIIETMSISYKTVDEAFENFLESHFNIDDFPDDRVQGKEFYNVGDDMFVPFEVDDNLSVVTFENGWFGWKFNGASFNIDNNMDFSGEIIGDKEIIYGRIPENIFVETDRVMVNDSFAKTIKLNADTGVWLIVKRDSENQDDTERINIQFIDGNGYEIDER